MSQTDDCVLILAPTGRDAYLAAAALTAAGLHTEICADIETLCREAPRAGAAVIAKEALSPLALALLTQTLAEQPPWADLPLVILTSGGRATGARRRRLEALEMLGNATLLERPLRVATLVSAVQVALMARRRQYEVRDHLEERLRAAAERERLLGQLEAIIQSMAEGVAICDSTGSMVTINPAHRRQLGFTQDGDLRQHLQDYPGILELASLEGSPLDPDEWPMARVLRGESIQNVEVQVRRADTGRSFIGSYNGAPVRDQAGNLLLAVVTVRDVTEAKRLEGELQAAYQKQHHIAETLQRSLLNAPPSNAFSGLEIETVYRAAWQEADIGGDYYDVFGLSAEKVALIVGDVSGKGLDAASRTAEVKYATRAFLREHPEPSEALSRLNAFLLDGQALDGQPLNNFVCMALGILDIPTGLLTVACAGAEPPLLLPLKGEACAVHGGGPPLGVMAGVDYPEHRIALTAGDTVLFVTDGITESRRGRDFFGYEGLVETAQQERDKETLAGMGQAIVQKAAVFAGGQLHDDVCLLLARYQTVSTPQKP